MEWWMMLMVGLSGPAVPAAAVLAPGQDGLTLEPLAITQTQDRPSTAVVPEEIESLDVISLEQSLKLDPGASRPSKSRSDDRSGFIYEPIYSTTSDRVEYQTGSGLGVGFTTDASLAISQSVRLRRGLDVSVYYAHPVDVMPRDTSPEIGDDLNTPMPAPSAGIRLEWKF